MSMIRTLAGAALKKMLPTPVVVGYQIFSKVDELVQDHRVREDKLSGQVVKELDALLRIDSHAVEGKDYLYFSIHGLKGASFAWGKAGNAMAFRIVAPDASGNGSSYVGRTYYLVTMFPVVVRPSEGIEILAHARAGKDNDKFFTSVLNDMVETSARLKKMVNPDRGLRAIP